MRIHWNQTLLGLFLVAFAGIGQVASAADFLMVVDSSGSMQDRTEDGQIKMAAAKSALGELRADLSAHQVGMLVFGHRTDPKTPGSCQDVELVMPIAEFSGGSYDAVIQRLQPRGSTPLANSLKRATTELMFRDKETPKIVIVVTDGNETCGGDPIAVARQMRGMGINVTVHVIGFGVKPHERRQLEELAKAGNGKFGLANTKAELEAAIREKIQPVAPEPKVHVVSVQANPELSPIETALVGRLTDKSAKVRRATAETLQKMKATATISHLSRRIVEEDEYYALRAAFYAVYSIDATAAETPLIDALQSKHTKRRIWAAEFAVNIENTSTETELSRLDRALVERLKDEQAEVRRAAADSLHKRKTIAATEALFERVQGETEFYAWRSALQALKTLSQPKAVEAIVTALGSNNATTRQWAADWAADISATN